MRAKTIVLLLAGLLVSFLAMLFWLGGEAPDEKIVYGGLTSAQICQPLRDYISTENPLLKNTMRTASCGAFKEGPGVTARLDFQVSTRLEPRTVYAKMAVTGGQASVAMILWIDDDVPEWKVP